jgi:hypothetical protein
LSNGMAHSSSSSGVAPVQSIPSKFGKKRKAGENESSLVQSKQ